jgi:hypothetical protein
MNQRRLKSGVRFGFGMSSDFSLHKSRLYRGTLDCFVQVTWVTCFLKWRYMKSFVIVIFRPSDTKVSWLSIVVLFQLGCVWARGTWFSLLRTNSWKSCTNRKLIWSSSQQEQFKIVSRISLLTDASVYQSVRFFLVRPIKFNIT